MTNTQDATVEELRLQVAYLEESWFDSIIERDKLAAKHENLKRSYAGLHRMHVELLEGDK